jgi:hypothetical protein
VRPHAAQVVIDIGVHPELPVPPGTGWHDGQTWNAEMAWELLRSHSRYPDAILRFELDRCLGLARLGHVLQARQAAPLAWTRCAKHSPGCSRRSCTAVSAVPRPGLSRRR